MVADGMLTRRRYREVPPRVEYELTERAYALMPVIGEVARWGYDWVWSPPRASERVDLGAIFRVAPGLLKPPQDMNAAVSLIVEDDESEPYVLVAEGGKVKVEEGEPEQADATISGSKDAWVAAFSPDGDCGRLRIEGDRPLATQLLDGLALRTEQLARATRAA
jgi:putative sterol carrier protein